MVCTAVWLGALAYLVAGILGGIVVLAASGDVEAVDATGPYAIAGFVALNAVASVGVVWLATYRKGLNSLRDDFGLTGRWLDPLIGLGLGIVGLIVAWSQVSIAADALSPKKKRPTTSLGAPVAVSMTFWSESVTLPVALIVAALPEELTIEVQYDVPICVAVHDPAPATVMS